MEMQTQATLSGQDPVTEERAAYYRRIGAARLARRFPVLFDAVADGRIDSKELDAQEKRVVDLMKQVDPLLSPEAHELVTQLLCEVTAYDLMNAMHMAGKARPKTKFRG